MDFPEGQILSPYELCLELRGEFCIETTGQLLYRRLSGGYLNGDYEGEEIEGAIALLAEFLEKEDFRQIRGQDEELAGDHRASVRVFRDENNTARWEKCPPRPHKRQEQRKGKG